LTSFQNIIFNQQFKKNYSVKKKITFTTILSIFFKYRNVEQN